MVKVGFKLCRDLRIGSELRFDAFSAWMCSRVSWSSNSKVSRSTPTLLLIRLVSRDFLGLRIGSVPRFAVLLDGCASTSPEAATLHSPNLRKRYRGRADGHHGLHLLQLLSATLRNSSRPLVSPVSIITELGLRNCCNSNYFTLPKTSVQWFKTFPTYVNYVK